VPPDLAPVVAVAEGAEPVAGAGAPVVGAGAFDVAGAGAELDDGGAADVAGAFVAGVEAAGEAWLLQPARMKARTSKIDRGTRNFFIQISSSYFFLYQNLFYISTIIVLMSDLIL